MTYCECGAAFSEGESCKTVGCKKDGVTPPSPTPDTRRECADCGADQTVVYLSGRRCFNRAECWERQSPKPPEKKETNPKDAVGIAKAPMSCVPAPVLLELGLAMAEGARKYGRHNYRVTGVRTSVYYDAAMRHLFAFWEGQDVDPDSGLSHLVKAMACLTVLRDADMRGMLEDDRPPKTGDDWVQTANGRMKELLKKYPECKPAHAEKDKP